MESRYSHRLGLQQRVLPSYRIEFFKSLARACQGGLSVFAGRPRAKEAIDSADALQVAHLYPAHNLHILSGKTYLCYQTNLMRWLEDWDPQALVIEANPRYLSSAAAIRWMHQRQRRVIGWGLGAKPSTGLMQSLGKRWRWRFLRQFDALLTYSRQGADDYTLAGFPRQKIFVAPNAVTHKPAFPLPERPVDTNRPPVVLFVGRLQERKRVDLLLEACAGLPRQLQPRLQIVGDGPARPSIEKLAAQIYPAAEFYGARYGAELAPFFIAADLFALPGTGGLAIQQAMSFGLPVLVGEADGTQRDLVRDENGWQVQPGNVDAIRATLQEALSDPARLRRMGAASYRIVSQEINIEVMVQAFLDALGGE